MQLYTIFFIAVSALHVSGGETSRNMYSIDSNKEYCITLYLVGYTWKNTVFSTARSTFRMYRVMATFSPSFVWGLFVRCTETFWSPCIYIS